MFRSNKYIVLFNILNISFSSPSIWHKECQMQSARGWFSFTNTKFSFKKCVFLITDNKRHLCPFHLAIKEWEVTTHAHTNTHTSLFSRMLKSYSNNHRAPTEFSHKQIFYFKKIFPWTSYTIKLKRFQPTGVGIAQSTYISQ